MTTRLKSDDDRTTSPGLSTGLVVRADAMPRAALWRRFVLRLVVLGLLWALLTGFRADALAFGVPAVLAAAALVFVFPASPRWGLSIKGGVEFALWFALQSVRGAVDVARRAFSPSLPLRPGFRSYRASLPDGAPHILFLNAITLLPGTLSAEIAGDEVVVHMLDTRADLEADLQELEARVAALFALPPKTQDHS